MYVVCHLSIVYALTVEWQQKLRIARPIEVFKVSTQIPCLYLFIDMTSLFSFFFFW